MYALKKNHLKKEEWDSLVLSIDQVSLMQTWEYGQALEAVGWSTERYVIYYQETPIAFFNAFKKRYWYATLIRIQRGPLFISSYLLEHHLSAVLSLIREKWTFWKLQFLRIEFELPFRPDYDKLVQALGFRRTGNLIWESTQIDLALSEEVLLKNLSGKWRNALNQSIKNQLVVNRAKNQANFECLVAQYEVFKKSKRFTGISKELLQALHDKMVKNKAMHTLLAHTGGGGAHCRYHYCNAW